VLISIQENDHEPWRPAWFIAMSEEKTLCCEAGVIDIKIKNNLLNVLLKRTQGKCFLVKYPPLMTISVSFCSVMPVIMEN